MSDQATVKTWPVVFGTAGTAASIACGGTNTSNPYPLARGPWSLGITVQVVGSATGTSSSTSAGAATVVGQCSNDAVGWFAVGSATAAAAIATTSNTSATLSIATAITAGAFQLGGNAVPYAYFRAILGGTGSGTITAFLAS